MLAARRARGEDGAGVPFTGRLNIDQGELGGSDLKEVLLASMQNTISLTELVSHQSEKIAQQSEKITEQSEKITGLGYELVGMRSELDAMKQHLDQMGTDTEAGIGAARDALDANLESINSTLQNQADELREEVATEISWIDEVEEEARRGKWPDGAFCFLANGACPSGFSTIHGHMKAIKLYRGTANYLSPANFGNSSIRCHGPCTRADQWSAELNLVTCCK